MTLTLTQDQQKAFDAMVAFICDPDKTTFVLEGFAGTGKSTLMQHFLDHLSDIQRTFKLINPSYREPDVEMTATTHKAAENLMDITGSSVVTIHSFLGLKLNTNYRTGKSTLEPKYNFTPPENCIVIVEEASYIDQSLLNYIYSRTKDCKIIFIGDPAQLVPVGYSYAPVFASGFETARLEEVMRNSGNILELATKFRNTVMTGEWFSFRPDGTDVLHLDRDAFNKAIETEFTRPDWTYKDSRFLSWTNQTAIDYNAYIRSIVKGDPNFQVGDYAVVNEYISVPLSNGNVASFKTDQTVHITGIHPEIREGIDGAVYVINGVPVFKPDNIAVAKRELAKARKVGDWDTVHKMLLWADLRAVYGQTVNKAQGSTYGKVFIDLDDLSRNGNANTLARLLYVGVSRAKHQVILTGDIV